ncbi:ABC transporter permease [Lactococcus hodotermopsidis]|uniref:ABC transporter permease n=1 Tax=Pseudolactococcus hodotermopsidis TaxID=2709157 RepID=A0A6A0BF40_9LACT|nr:ABC transporter permease [Lactococcus hodotermopsidis]GFH43315.1 ABC transporter permease [Lactococcus hodotermopsidis]
MRNKLAKYGVPLILPLLIVMAWYTATTLEVVPTLILPKLGTIGAEMQHQLIGGTIIEDLRISLLRIAKGYALATSIGVLLGVLMGMSPKVYRVFSLTFTAIRQIPMIAWVPLLVMWFGIGEESKVAVIFMASYFPVLVNTMSGIGRTDKKLLEVGQMYQLSKWQLFTKIYLPSALPSIFVGLKLGLGISWMAVVGAEMIAASSGIGFRLNDARALMQFPIVFCGMIAIAVVGLVLDAILDIIGKKLTPWENLVNH